MKKQIKKQKTTFHNQLQQRNWFWISLLFICIIYMYWPQLSGKAFLWFDAVDHAIIRLETICNSFANGRVPLWDSTTHGGQPAIGDPAYGIFYPFHILAALVTRLRGTYSFSYINILVVLESFFGCFGMYYLSRRNLHFPKYCAFFSALMFFLSTSAVCRVLQYVHYTQIVMIPWIILGVMGLRNGSRYYLVGMSLLWAMTLLGANPQYSYYTALAIAIYAIVDAISLWSSEKNLRTIALLVVKYVFFLVIGFGLAAFAILPIYEYIQAGIRTNSNFALGTGTPLKQFITYLIPFWYGEVSGQATPYFGRDGFWNYWEYSQYVGISGLILSGIGIWYSKKNSYWVYIICLLGFSWLYAYGVNNPIPSLLPMGKSMRIPGKFLIFAAFSFSLLAGMGLKEIADKRYNSYLLKRILKYGIIVSTTGLVFVICIRLIGLSMFAKNPSQASFIFKGGITCLILCSVVFGLLFLYVCGKIKFLTFLVFLIIICFVDLTWHNRSFNISKIAPGKKYQEYAFVNKIKKEMETEKFRVKGGSYTFNNLCGTHHGLHTMNGYTANVMKWYTKVRSGRSKNEQRFLDLFNVKYEFLVNRTRGLAIITRKTYVPRAYIIRKFEKCDEENLLNKLYSDNFDPLLTALVSTNFEGQLSFPLPETKDTIKIIQYKPEYISLNVTLDTPGYLVMSENDYPGWIVTVDNVDKDIIRVNGTFRAVKLSSGQHKVEWRFKPMSFRYGLWISLVSLIFVLLVVCSKVTIRKPTTNNF